MNFEEIKVKDKKVISFKVSEESVDKWNKLLSLTKTKGSKTFEYIVDKLYSEKVNG
jgi:hypothetical protein